MSVYSNSETTRMALIMELFAEHGHNAVTTRAIAEKAGENIGVIHYHFGCKDGLINAVMDFVNEPWTHDPLGALLSIQCLPKKNKRKK
jgi:AcrR family transcriptional regulator